MLKSARKELGGPVSDQFRFAARKGWSSCIKSVFQHMTRRPTSFVRGFRFGMMMPDQ